MQRVCIRENLKKRIFKDIVLKGGTRERAEKENRENREKAERESRERE